MTLTGLTTMVACKKPGGDNSSLVCIHAWQDATCLTARTCSKCGKTQGQPLGHDFVGDVCLRCGEKKEIPLQPTEGLEYELNDDGKSYSLVGIGTADSETIVIPSAYKNLPVTTIDEHCFVGDSDATNKLKSIVIPDSVVLIKQAAIGELINLESLTLPNSELVIEPMSIAVLPKLNSLYIPEKVKEIGSGNFAGSGLQSITIHPDNANYCVKNNCIIEKSTKTLLVAGKNATIPNDGSVTIIGSYSFVLRSDLKTLTIPEGVTTIGENAFFNCFYLYSVVLADSVEEIGASAFSDCYNLLSVTFGKNLKNIGSDAFVYYYYNGHIIEIINRSSLDITADSEEYGYFARNAVSIKTDGITDLVNIDDCLFYPYEDGYHMLAYIGGQSELVFPSSVNGKKYKVDRVCNINDSLFGEYAAAFGVVPLTKVVISDGVTEILEGAFSNCGDLLSVTVGKNVTSIQDYAFYNCEKLVEVINYSGLEITIGSSDHGRIALYALSVKQSGTSDIVNVGDYVFFTANNANYLLGYKGTKTELVLPDNYNGKTYEIYNYAFYDCEYLTSVVIPNGVTSIGNYAFKWCNGLTSLIIPDGVTSIGEGAFYNLGNLKSIVIPESVTSIGEHAFNHCYRLTSVVIPNGVTSIGKETFYGCSALTSVTIPDSVISIGDRAFYDCDVLTSITIPNGVTSIGENAFSGCYKLVEVINYSELDITVGSSDHGGIALYALSVKQSGTSDVVNKNGYLFYTANKVNYLLGYAGSEAQLTLPKNYNGQNYEIYNYAFYNCDNITSVTIPNSVTSIGDSAFYDCDGLTEIVIPESVTSIGDSAFQYCSDLTSVTIGSGVTSIGYQAFYGCNNLISIVVDDNNQIYCAINNCVIEKQSKTLILGCKNSVIPSDGSVTSIGDYAFIGCTGLTSIVIPEGVTSIGYEAFYDCDGLTEIVIPENVTSIGQEAFYWCSNLKSVVFENIDGWYYTNGEKISSDELSDPEKAASLLTSKDTSYYYEWINCSGSIDENATEGLRYTLNDDGESYSCSGYGAATDTAITISSTYNGLPVTAIKEKAFWNKDNIVSVVIPDSVTSIGERAFEYCNGLTSLTIGSSVTSIGDYAFDGCEKLVEVINYSGLNIKRYSSNYGYVAYYALNVKQSGISDIVNKNDYLFYTCDKVNYLLGYVGSATELTLPNSYNGQNYPIYEYAFYGCNNITSVTIPDSVTSIGYEAFYSCDGLTSVTIGNGVTWIGGFAFGSCDGLTSVTIPDSVTWIENSAFWYCRKLESLIVSKDNQKYCSINNCLIEKKSKTLVIGCKNSVIPSGGGVTTIGEGAFRYCYGLTEIVIPQGVTSIGERAFYDCSDLTSVSIGNGATSIGERAFGWCSKLTSVIIPDSVTTIGDGAFV